jgi:hypothetical protein
VELVHAALGRLRLDRLDQRGRDLLGVRVRRLVGEARERLRDLALAEVVVGETTAADDVADDLLALTFELRREPLRGLDGVGVEGAGQAAVAREEQDRGAGRVLRLRRQRVLGVRSGTRPPG